MKFPTMDEFAQNVAEKALDEYEYKGKTLRQWIEIISASEHGTNLASLGTDCISRHAAIDGINELMKVHFDRKFVLGKARTIMQELPPAEPQIIRCKDCKHWDIARW